MTLEEQEKRILRIGSVWKWRVGLVAPAAYASRRHVVTGVGQTFVNYVVLHRLLDGKVETAKIEDFTYSHEPDFYSPATEGCLDEALRELAERYNVPKDTECYEYHNNSQLSREERIAIKLETLRNHLGDNDDT